MIDQFPQTEPPRSVTPKHSAHVTPFGLSRISRTAFHKLVMS